MSDDGLIHETVLVCPACAHRAPVTMPRIGPPRESCPGCGFDIKAGPDECCVFCAHAVIPCPARQRGARSCCGGD